MKFLYMRIIFTYSNETTTNFTDLSSLFTDFFSVVSKDYDYARLLHVYPIIYFYIMQIYIDIELR
jgi:hypothetical protein